MTFDYSDSFPPQNLKITADLVRQLIGEQFPRWADLPIEPVELSGWDNKTFHLGDTMSVRLPSAQGYAAQVEKEHRWLPLLASCLPLPIPKPLAMGVPSDFYPWHWSVYRWLDGENATPERITNLPQFATDLGRFLTALQQINADDAPPPGKHNFFRGAPPSVYDGETRHALIALHDEIDVNAANAVWEAALSSTWQDAPVWVHGDVAAGNLLVKEGKLAAVIDFGCCAIGDPACDLTIAWTLLTEESREAFRAALPLDSGTWARGRGWELWKALITLAEHRETHPAKANEARHVLKEVIADHFTLAR
jgi:aminoglycoside phosphotransferase (APT) family kinase protein